ncbi:MAG TPA: DUF5916 domain-containing protein [Rhodothermales bacterium]|nr:DUF5916 domain-containing protein [Rhodothermales bacterium]
MMLLILVLSLFLSSDTTAHRDSCTATTDCTLTAKPVVGSIDVDGRLDESDWEAAPVASGFQQFEPQEGAAPSQRTEVRVLYGKTAVYVGAMLYDTQPDRILQTLGRRDDFNQADWFTVSIDSYFDRKTAYQFAVSAAGVQVDGIYTEDLDASWDAVWESAVQTTSEGWVAEIRIPYSMLRFAEADVQQWGINFRRHIPRNSEVSEWVLIPRTERGSGTVAQYGILNGLNDIQPRRNIQVTPYTVARLQTEEGDPGEPFRSSTIDVGGDLKIGLSSNVTLDATFLPDFGQVESDPAELNLSAFETFFGERRPFFTEGVQIFQFNLERGDRLLYTRRIGSKAPIIGATKLSGRTSTGLSFGFLGATTGHDLDPDRHYGVARLHQQIGRVSGVGGILTATDFNAADEQRRAFAGGTDWDLRFKNNTYQLEGQASVSHRRLLDEGNQETGFSTNASFGKIQGVWGFSTGFIVISDDFNTNDLGSLRRDNYMNVNGSVSHEINGGQPFGPFQRAAVEVSGGNGFAYADHTDVGLGIFVFSNFETRRFQSIDLNIRSDYLIGGYDLFETRGLGPRAKPREVTFGGSFETDSRRAWQLEPGAEIEFKDDGGRSYEAELELDWNMSQHVSLSFEISHDWEQNQTAWASNASFAPLEDGWGVGEDRSVPSDETVFHAFDDGGLLGDILAVRGPFDEAGRFYLPVFGQRDTRSMDLTLRSGITLSPTLSIQLYGQLFAARGRYDDFSLLQDRDTFAPLPTYPKRHDFAFNSFQTNTVLRWEYRPGSTLFLVWSQVRNGDDVLDVFDRSRSPFDQSSAALLTDTFDLFPTNVFLLKLNYKFLR